VRPNSSGKLCTLSDSDAVSLLPILINWFGPGLFRGACLPRPGLSRGGKPQVSTHVLHLGASGAKRLPTSGSMKLTDSDALPNSKVKS
jgi:hypothetical protein